MFLYAQHDVGSTQSSDIGHRSSVIRHRSSDIRLHFRLSLSNIPLYLLRTFSACVVMCYLFAPGLHPGLANVGLSGLFISASILAYFTFCLLIHYLSLITHHLFPIPYREMFLYAQHDVGSTQSSDIGHRSSVIRHQSSDIRLHFRLSLSNIPLYLLRTFSACVVMCYLFAPGLHPGLANVGLSGLFISASILAYFTFCLLIHYLSLITHHLFPIPYREMFLPIVIGINMT
jgi:hypothetical protein